MGSAIMKRPPSPRAVIIGIDRDTGALESFLLQLSGRTGL